MASSFALRLDGKVVTRYDSYAEAEAAKAWHAETYDDLGGELTVDLIPTEEQPLRVYDGRRDIGS